MKLTDIELEGKEKYYMSIISFILDQDVNMLISKLSHFPKKEDIVAHLFYYLFTPVFKFTDSLTPSCRLSYPVPDALLQINVKTASMGSKRVPKGEIAFNWSQAFCDSLLHFIPELPEYHYREAKPCLTYAIQIIHEHAKPNIKALKLLCIPNGQLFPHYGKSIFRSGKGGYAHAKDFRYNYASEPFFKLLRQKYQQDIFRVELIYLAKDLKPKEITNLSNVPVHFQS